MDKLKLAHDYVKTILSMSNACHTMDDAVNIGWQYADMMLAEQEKRTTVLDEFQVDWSQAPDWAKYWCALVQKEKITGGFWMESKPVICEGSGGRYSEYSYNSRSGRAPSFNYQGDWKSSVQERK